jgi:hypothetical protein
MSTISPSPIRALATWLSMLPGSASSGQPHSCSVGERISTFPLGVLKPDSSYSLYWSRLTSNAPY